MKHVQVNHVTKPSRPFLKHALFFEGERQCQHHLGRSEAARTLSPDFASRRLLPRGNPQLAHHAIVDSIVHPLFPLFNTTGYRLQLEPGFLLTYAPCRTPSSGSVQMPKYLTTPRSPDMTLRARTTASNLIIPLSFLQFVVWEFLFSAWGQLILLT